jgi:Lysylphosphatidylglycerol synthase TM region
MEPHRSVKLIFAIVGIALFAWTIARVGPFALAAQIPSVGPVLILALCLAAFRFLLQATGWRLSMPVKDRPGTKRAILAVVGGEAAGYLTWGPLSREPVKAMLVSDHLPARESMGAAVAERMAYTGSAAGLAIAGLIILAARTHHAAFVAPGILALGIAGAFAMRWRRSPVSLEKPRPTTAYVIIGLTTLQEITNVFETYMIFSWLGAIPTLEAAIVFEGLTRLANSAGAFVPGKLGVSEVAGVTLAEAMGLGSVLGLTLALTRRLRSLLWTGAGVLVLFLLAARRSRTRSPAPNPAIA